MTTIMLRDNETIAHGEGTVRHALVPPPGHEHDHEHEESA